MSLFQRLGGSQAISAVVDKFYDFMLQDQRVAHYFTSIDMNKQKKRQKQFITLVTGGENSYEGTDMKTAHCKHSIGQMQFNATWQNLQLSLKHFKVPKEQTDELKSIFYSVQSQIVNRKQQKTCPFNLQLNKTEETSQKTLYQKLGGQPALNLVVNTFYDMMFQDPRVSFYFSNTNMQEQRNSQIQFLTMVTGGPNNYKGKDMKSAHCPYIITNGQFDATWQNLQKSLEKYSVDQVLIKQVKEIFYSVRQQIVDYNSVDKASNQQKKCPLSSEMQEQTQSQNQKSLFSRLGGHGALYLVVNRFYDLMLKDSRVNYYFANTNIQKQKASQIEFLSMVTGGPNNYNGKDMKSAHCPYKIGCLQFDATWQNLSTALKYNGVKDHLLKQVQSIFYSVEDEIVCNQNTRKHQHQKQVIYIIQADNTSSDQQKLMNQNSTTEQKVTQHIVHIPVTMKQSTNLLNNHMPITISQPSALKKHHSGSNSPRMDQSSILKCPHMTAKLSSLSGQHNLSQNQKLRIKKQVINKQLQAKSVKKLNNCPYKKIYY